MNELNDKDMNTLELKDKYWSLYEYMANSGNPENMKLFGRVMTQMMDDVIQSSPSKAEEYIDRLEAIKWKNYLTPKEAEKIIAGMEPKAPWSREQWAVEMQKHGYPQEKEPCYNRCALWVTMNMIMSDSSETIAMYVDSGNMFKLVHDLAVDKLTDRDGVFNIRRYFDV